MEIFLDWPQADVVNLFCQHQEMLRDLSKRETRGVDKGRFKTYIDAIPVEIRIAYSIWCSGIHNGRQQRIICKRVGLALENAMYVWGTRE